VETPVDLLEDPFIDVGFTDEQRHLWGNIRSELIIARERMHELEERLRVLEQHNHEDLGAQAVLTRPEFNREVARMLAFDERYGGISSVLYFDIENLSDIIEHQGHAMGNAVVRTVCDTLAVQIRSSDILGRLATDEFGVLLVRCDNPAAWKKAEKLAGGVFQALAKIKDCKVPPVVSYGAYTFREKENLATGLKQAALSVTRIEEDDEEDEG